MRRWDSNFLFGLLVIVFAWLNPSDHWSRIGLIVVGLLIVLYAFSPTCACGIQRGSAAPVMKKAKKSVKKSAKRVRKPAKKSVKRKATKKKVTRKKR